MENKRQESEKQIEKLKEEAKQEIIIKRNLKMDQFGDFENNQEDEFKPAQWPTS